MNIDYNEYPLKAELDSIYGETCSFDCEILKYKIHAVLLHHKKTEISQKTWSLSSRVTQSQLVF